MRNRNTFGAGCLLCALLVAAVFAPEVRATAVGPTDNELETTDGSTPAATAGPTTTVAATTTSAPTTAPQPTEPERTRLVVNGVGDTNLDPSYIPALAAEGYGHAFSGLDGAFLDDDLTVVNLECAASTIGARVPKAFNFNCDLAALPVMRDAGVEVANLANNHSGDYGIEAMVDTRANVAAAGIAPVGVGADQAEASGPAVFEINGWTVAVVGFGGVVPAADWLAGDGVPGMASGDDTESMVAAVRAADEIADLVIVTVHWGAELDLAPRADDVARARAMIDAGADAIFGHHPHRLQPLEFHNGRPIAWSLGNFVWPSLSAAGSTTAIAQVVVEPDGSIGACLVPVYIESNGHPVVQVDLTGPCTWDGHDGPVPGGGPPVEAAGTGAGDDAAGTGSG